jgi:acyl-CoA reductase-like NAD-dependent aldehyde dehydrogenase
MAWPARAKIQLSLFGSYSAPIRRRQEVQVREYQQFIGGEWVSSDDLFDDYDPYRGTVMARVPAGTRADAARAVDAAAAAFPGWAELPPASKQMMFLRAADIVERRQAEIVALLAQETGCAGGFAGFQVLTATRLLRQAANWGYLPVGEVIRSDMPGTFALALRKPVGVVAGISPWNGAHVLAWRTVVNPVAFGNTVVLKPSEEAPVSAGLLIPEIMTEAGFPAGVINVVTHAPGAAAPIADEFFERPEVRCINFTGSSATGRLLAERAGRHLKRCVLELGGYNPLIVLADADLDYAVEAAAFAAFFHQGQICMSARKVLVERPVYDEFTARLVQRTQRLRIGDPAEPGTVIGPLINAAALDRVSREVDRAVSAGAKVLAGGRADGPCYLPTILADVPAGEPIHAEETFGPVLVMQPVADAEEAVSIANSTRYGLSAGLITGDNQRGFVLARRIDAGVVHVNDQTVADEPQLPLGGVKDSGWGRSGPGSMADFTETQWITTRDGSGSFPI